MPNLLARAALAAILAGALALGNSPAAAGDALVEFKGSEGPGAGKTIVIVTGDDEYRSEESMPRLGQILARWHGFNVTVLFAIDPATGLIDPAVQNNIPGLEKLAGADLMIIFARFRHLPDDQMKPIVEYLDTGKPIIGLRTSTHAFAYPAGSASPYAKYDWQNKEFQGGFGRQVLGETWISHFGRHQVESTRGLIAPGMESSPLVRGCEDIWGPSDVYGITTLHGDAQPVVLGQILKGMNPGDEPKPGMKQLPVAWTKSWTGPSGKTARVFNTTMGHGGDLQSEGFRRLMVNACYWALGMEEKIPERAKVDLIGEYNPTPIGFGTAKKGVKPSDYALPAAQ